MASTGADKSSSGSSGTIIPELTLALLSSMNNGEDPRQVEQVVVPNKMIMRISEEISGKCKLIKKLDLSKNLLTDVGNVFQNYLPNLTWVSLANNQIDRIAFPETEHNGNDEEEEEESAPKWHIKVFNASGNQLSDLSFLRHLGDDVKAVILTGNEIRDVSGLADTSRIFRSGLDTLVLSHNKIERLGESFATLEGLRKLNVGNNLLREVPPEVFRMRSLRELRLNGNKIVNVPQAAFWQCLPHLTILDLGNNLIFNLGDIANLAPLASSLVQANFLGNPIAPAGTADCTGGAVVAVAAAAAAAVPGKKSGGGGGVDIEKYRAFVLSVLPNLTNLDNTSLGKGAGQKHKTPRGKKDSKMPRGQQEEEGEGGEESGHSRQKRDRRQERPEKLDRREKAPKREMGPQQREKFAKRNDLKSSSDKTFGGGGGGRGNYQKQQQQQQRQRRGGKFHDDEAPEEVHSGFRDDEHAKSRRIPAVAMNPAPVVVKKREEVSRADARDPKRKAVRMVFDEDGETTKRAAPAKVKPIDEPPPQKMQKRGKDEDSKKSAPLKHPQQKQQKGPENMKALKKKEAADKTKAKAPQKKAEPAAPVQPAPAAPTPVQAKKVEAKKNVEGTGIVDIKKIKTSKTKTVKSSKTVMKALLADPDDEVSSW